MQAVLVSQAAAFGYSHLRILAHVAWKVPVDSPLRISVPSTPRKRSLSSSAAYGQEHEMELHENVVQSEYQNDAKTFTKLYLIGECDDKQALCRGTLLDCVGHSRRHHTCLATVVAK